MKHGSKIVDDIRIIIKVLTKKPTFRIEKQAFISFQIIYLAKATARFSRITVILI
jgi:hypothetical protein